MNRKLLKCTVKTSVLLTCTVTCVIIGVSWALLVLECIIGELYVITMLFIILIILLVYTAFDECRNR